jgi:hypothetical protein
MARTGDDRNPAVGQRAVWDCSALECVGYREGSCVSTRLREVATMKMAKAMKLVNRIVKSGPVASCAIGNAAPATRRRPAIAPSGASQRHRAPVRQITTAAETVSSAAGTPGAAIAAAFAYRSARIVESSSWAPPEARFYAPARGLQKGDAVQVITLTSVSANVSSITGGLVVFGDAPSDPVGIVLQGLALLLVIVAAELMPGPLRLATA